VENCQTVVFMAYVTARAHALFDFRLYLPKAWCQDDKRRERAHLRRLRPRGPRPLTLCRRAVQSACTASPHSGQRNGLRLARDRK
jgi:hypothetical protein